MKTNLTQRMIVSLTITFLFFYSCTDPFKNKYAGKWIEVQREDDIISIDKNNEDYIVTYEGKRLPAIYKDRNLEVTIGGLNPKMMLDEHNDRILFLEKEYIRIENSLTSKFCGIWKLGTEANYLKILKDEEGRFKFNIGYEYEGKKVWVEPDLEYGDGIYLKLLNGKLKGQFVSSNFLATHGQSFNYKLTLELTFNNKLLYTVNSDLGVETDEATKISN